MRERESRLSSLRAPLIKAGMVKISSRRGSPSSCCNELLRKRNADKLAEVDERNVGDSICADKVLIAAENKKEGDISYASKYLVGNASGSKKKKKYGIPHYKKLARSEDALAGALLKVHSSTCEAEIEEVYGYRFTKEEDAILKDAVRRYMKGRQWEEEEALEKMRNCRKHREAYGCWSEIKMCLPHRPLTTIRNRALTVFDKGSYLGRWSKQEEELLRSLHKRHGNKWRLLSTLMGRSQSCVKEKWRCLKRTKATGVWTPEEIQRLSDMVHRCLRSKSAEDKSVRRILRDNINWDIIADSIVTHSHGNCCYKWYTSLSPAMVTDGLWASKDDFLLLESLLESGACTEEEVEWNSLLSHRSGQTCLLRWKQLGKHLGENQSRGFLEKLDSLVRRYAAELL